MPHFAIINSSNVVDNIIVADDLETANEIATSSISGQLAVQISSEPNAPTMGWIWNGTELVVPEATE